VSIRVQPLRGFEHGQDGLSIIIRGDAVDGDFATLFTLMDKHQLSLRLSSIFTGRVFKRQPYGFHARLARRKAVPRFIQIEMARRQAIRAMVAVVAARQRLPRRNDIATIQAYKTFTQIAKPAGTGVVTPGGKADCHDSALNFK
jgi:hypothetical protein